MGLLKHGESRRNKISKTYSIWCTMLQRCRNPNCRDYPDYGGRGITVCERWRDYSNFLADMGSRPDGMSIERKDNNKGYSPDNCEWATYAKQMLNRRSNHLITHNGKTQTLTEWARELGINRGTLDWRIRKGRPPFVSVRSSAKQRGCSNSPS